jgi:predicted phage baseplate assembly protein
MSPRHEFPPLLAPDSRSVRREISGRVRSYTPEWAAMRDDDPGIALVKVFSEQAAVVRRQLGRLDQKWRLELLRIAGVSSRPATPALVSLELTLADTADRTVFVPAGLRLSVPPAGDGDAVAFETVEDVWATSAVVAALVTQAGSRVARVTPAEVSAASGLLPFDRRPQPGNALWIGLSGAVPPSPQVSLAFDLLADADTGAAVGVGGLHPPTEPGRAALVWSVLTSTGLVAVQPLADSTAGLEQSGVVRLPTPSDWPAVEHPSGDPGHVPLRWLRVALIYGEPRHQLLITAIRLNVVRAEAIRTVRDEVLTPLSEPSDPSAATRPRYVLSTTPVVPGSVRLVVDLDVAGDPFDLAPDGDAASAIATFEEVETFAGSRPTDRHFIVDHASGVVTFGDGTHGLAPSPGFRNVRAERYEAGGGSAGAVGAGAAFSLSDSVAFLTAVTNRTAATGGLDAESLEQIDRRGPALVRAGGRAVVADDYAVLALDAPGAGVARALALPAAGQGPMSRPGQVTVVVVPVARTATASLVPDEETLRAVAEHLTRVAAPIGARVVAKGPRYARIAVDTVVEVDAGADRTAVVARVLDATDRYLSPFMGGDDGAGWPFGEPVRHRRLAALIGRVEGVASVATLRLLLNGRPQAPCADVALAPDGLPMAGGHVVIPLDPSVPGGRP